MKLLVLIAAIAVAFAEETFIVGGRNVTQEGKYPWQGSLRLNGGHNCGLSLVSEKWGVTAAHCVEGSATEDFTFQFGSLNRLKGGVVVTAKQIIMHEKYGQGDGAFPNDIAVIEFAQEVKGRNIKSIPMAAKGTDHAGKEDCWITGWGYTDFWTFELPEILQEAKINVYTNSFCDGKWPGNVNDGHICIGDSVNKKTSCNGDSGGPLVCKVNDRYELVGATSWGPFGCGTTVPAAYSRVAYFRDWIKSKTGL